jgi:hypothetical protein
MKAEIALGIIDIAGQTPEPAFAEARPQERPTAASSSPAITRYLPRSFITRDNTYSSNAFKEQAL